MKKIKFNTLVCLSFLLIIIVGLIIRIYKVDSAPSGVLVDEASFGYNAYSILKTGRDEHNISFPLVFRAFGDQKLPAYAYSTIPFIKTFGLNNLAIRIPSVLAGSLLSGVIFLLLIEVGFTFPLSFIGGFITATSPWAIVLSRFGFESNFALFFFVLGLFLSYKSYRRHYSYFAVLGGLSFGVTLYSYVAFKLITPIVLIGLIILHYLKNKTSKSISIMLGTTFVLSIIPILITVFSSQSTARFNQVGNTYNTGLKMEINEDRTYCGLRLPRFICTLSSNKPLFYVRTYLYRYITALSPTYLFLEGDSEYKYLNIDQFGAFYVWLLPFYFFGFVYLWKKIKLRSLSAFDVILIFGVFISALPTLMVSGPQKVRMSAFFPFILLVVLQGVSSIESQLQKSRYKSILYFALIITSLLSVCYFMIHYLTIHINKYETSYGTYIPKLMQYLGKQDKNTQIYMRSIPEGIIYFAYFNAVDPKIYQKNVRFKQSDAIGFAHPKDLLNVHIVEQDLFGVACDAKKKNEHAIFVSSDNDLKIPASSKMIFSSENGVETPAVVYDLKNIIIDYALCPKK